MTGWTGKRGRKLKSKLEKTKQKVKTMARDLYDDHFKAVESMPRGVVVTLRNIATQLESAWELHTHRQVKQTVLHMWVHATSVCQSFTLTFLLTGPSG